jgi:hypothetical protein
MLEYFALCFLCILALCITLAIEPFPNEDTPLITKITLFIFTIPIIPVLLLLYIITKVIRDD